MSSVAIVGWCVKQKARKARKPKKKGGQQVSGKGGGQTPGDGKNVEKERNRC